MDTPGPGAAGGAERLCWQVWPAAQRPVLSVAVALLGLAVSLGAMWSLESGWYAFITLAVLTAALAPHYLPSEYELDSEGVQVRSFGRRLGRPWSAFRLAVVLPDRVVLSPLSEFERLIARRRSVTLRLGEQPEAVVAYVGRFVPLRTVSL